MEELLEWSYSILAALGVRANTLVRMIETQQGDIKVSLDVQQNELTRFQIKIQMVTMGLALCSMVSGCECNAPCACVLGLSLLSPRTPPPHARTHAVFGMNLSNGWCGPEGCEILGTQDSGRAGFAIVIFSTLAVAVAATYFFYAFGTGKVHSLVLYFLLVVGAITLILTLKNLSIYYPSSVSGWR